MQEAVPLLATKNLAYGTAQKTKSIRVKPMQCLLNDPSVLEKFLLDTIEGHQMLKAGSMVCIGVEGEAWQQDNDKIHKAYSPSEVSADGWVTFVPKPESVREFVEVMGEPGQRFRIRAQWGERVVDDHKIVLCQFGEVGDFVLRNADVDHGVNQEGIEDVWIVKRAVFLATYEIKCREMCEVCLPAYIP